MAQVDGAVNWLDKWFRIWVSFPVCGINFLLRIIDAFMLCASAKVIEHSIPNNCNEFPFWHFAQSLNIVFKFLFCDMLFN